MSDFIPKSQIPLTRYDSVACKSIKLDKTIVEQLKKINDIFPNMYWEFSEIKCKVCDVMFTLLDPSSH